MVAITRTPKWDLQRLLTMELWQRVRSKELLLFYTQMSILIESGTNVPTGLEALEKQTPKAFMKSIIADLGRMVQEGQMLSQAMARYPQVFPPIHVGMIRAGESGGFLAKVFARLVLVQEQQQELCTMIYSAFAYPAVLLAVAVAVVIFMLTVILPKFIAVYESAGVVLPLMTRILLVIYAALSGYWYVIVPVVGALAWFGGQYAMSTSGRTLLDRIKVDLPLIGLLFRQVYLERLLRTMGILLDSGVPMYDTILLTRDTIGNARYRQLMARVLDDVNQGRGLSAAMSTSDLIPPMVRQMLQTGEDAGLMGSVMSRVADFYAERIRDQVRVLTRLLEPFMTLVMGGIIGFVALALLLPILQLARTIHPS